MTVQNIPSVQPIRAALDFLHHGDSNCARPDNNLLAG
jgi:hypothetical protein